ncbi:MAG TPA: 30S ribosomal protein S1, partial [Lactococcus sp.]|nr:30S ribosomal protein S1 [Lactococcus sp.]
EDGEKRERKPRAPRKAAKPSYDLPETQEGFSLADFLGEDFDINDL